MSIDGPTMTAASMESCRFAARRSPGGRFWSVVDVRKRLHRTRGGFHRCIHISKVLCALLLWTMICHCRVREAERDDDAGHHFGGWPAREIELLSRRRAAVHVFP